LQIDRDAERREGTMLKEAASALIGAAMSVAGSFASAADTACSVSGDNSQSCQQSHELATACDGQDAIESSKK